MATTVLSFGAASTLLGLDYAPSSAHAAATRASFQAFPTVSYSGTGPTTSFTVTMYVGPLFTGSVTGVFYVTSLGGGSATSGGSAISTTSTFAQGTTVTFTGTSGAQLQAFLQGIYVGDTAATSATDRFKLNLSFNDGNGVAKTYSMYYDVAAVCYLRGTGIATDQGDVAVEDLRIGDMVRTIDGSFKPVKFIGLQTFEKEFVAAAPAHRPVLIRKDAMGANLPARDLMVSPMHSLFVDDVLVPAVALENGVSILRADVPGDVEYFHVELDGHHVILAEGLPAESFIDDQSRAVFDNAYEYETLYGEGEKIEFLAPRLEEGYTVAALRRRFAEMAGIAAPRDAVPGAVLGHVERIEDGVLEGWVMDQDNAELALEIEVIVEGELVGKTLANRYRADLDHAGLAGGRCGFTMALPASVASMDQVQVRLVATGAELRKAVNEDASA